MKQFLSGLLSSLPIASGYIPVAITFGLIARSGGLSLTDATLGSVIIFAGAAQFLAVGMFFSGAASLQIIISGTLLNLRHLLMSSVIATHMETRPSPVMRNIIAFGVTDEVFGVAGWNVAQGQRLNAHFLWGLEAGAYTSWVGGTVIGAVAGNILPLRLQTALGVALYALFSALLAGQIRSTPAGRGRLTVILVALLSGGLNWLLRSLAGMDPGAAFPVAMIAAALLGAVLKVHAEADAPREGSS